MATNEAMRLAQVSADHHRWLKIEAARRGVSMVELLTEVIQVWRSGAEGRDEKRRITEQAAERARLSIPPDSLGLMGSDRKNPFLTLLEDGK